MHTILLAEQWTEKELEIDLTNISKESFLQEIQAHFGEVDLSTLYIKREFNVPAIFRTPEVMDMVIADSFWEWKTHNESDQKLLAYYMEITQDNTKTINDAIKFKSEKQTYLRRK